MKRKKPELLAPAGDWPSLTAAVSSGADSVYFGVQSMNMRHFAVNFQMNELKKIMQHLHSHDKKGYLTLNTIVMNKELPKVSRLLSHAKEAGVDAVILWDMAVFSLAKKIGIPIHLSTQASVANSDAVLFFAQLGVKRIVLARECSLNDIRAIRKRIDKQGLSTQIEAFIHGAMCVSVSGRCFLSLWAHNDSANRGRCYQPCRREFTITSSDKSCSYILGNDYLLSPHDLCTIDFIDQLIAAGINAFKIEGRARSADYVKTVVGCYRKAIDAVCDKTFDEQKRTLLKKELVSVYNRGFSTGFYFGAPQDCSSSGPLHTHKKQYVGEITKYYKRIHVAEIILKNTCVRKGDELLFMGKHTVASQMSVEELEQDHKKITAARKGERVGVKVPFRVRVKDKVFLVSEKS